MSSPERNEPIELELPDGVLDGEQAVELIRAWIVDGSLMVALNADAFDDRMQDWGRLLAQIGHHLAKAAALQGHMSEPEALAALRKGFEAMHTTHEPSLSGKVRGRQTH